MAESERKQEVVTLMTESQHKQDNDQVVVVASKKKIKKKVCLIVTGAVLLLFIIVAIILAFTVFKIKEPKIQLVSATLEGVAPQVTDPATDIQINITIDLKLQIKNRNHASFKHHGGKSMLLYKGKEVGDADIYPGEIASRASTEISCRLTVQADKLGSNWTTFVDELRRGEISMDTVTRLPGRVTLLGFIKKHVVAKINCQFTINVSEFTITKQTCKNKAKL